MHNIFLSFLGFLARLIIQRHKPYIIGITGTVGKTTIATHVTHFLMKKFGSKNVAYSPYHYNGEFGLPLTIIGMKSPWRNPFWWMRVFFVSIIRLFKKYPHYLVLEYGIDHPGEMDFLLSIAVPDIAVITPVEPNHLEQFGSIDNYRNHKIKIIKSAKCSIIHESLRQYIETDALYYSLWALSDIDASRIEIHLWWTRAIAHFDNQDYPLSIPAIGAFQIENLLPLYAIAQTLNINPLLISEYASSSHPESGRSSIIPGIMDTTIIDGSYNGWYLSLREWIISMRSFLYSHRIIFFLWDMRELGESSQEIHEKLWKDILENIPHTANVAFYLVGPLMKQYIAPLLSKKFVVFSDASSRFLGTKILEDIKKHKQETIVYAKWSQNTIFIEEGLKILLKNKSDIQKLPRQAEFWMQKKEDFFSSLRN